MAIILKKADFSKNGWQEHRNSALKGCGMGKALEAFKDNWGQSKNSAL
jgi:hypothetical protein